MISEKMDSSTLAPIILSSSVNIMDQSVVLKNPTERLQYTLESIDHWLKISPKIRLVICDGSAFDFSPVLLEKYPQAMAEDRIECLSFMNNSEKVAIFGKGYGEGEIIQFALTHSQILKEETVFCKCTGKLWVDNFLECLAEFNGKFLCQAYFSNVFSFKKTRLEYVDTRFYIADIQFYLRHFAELHYQVGGHFQSSIEDVYKEKILQENLFGCFFKKFPLVRGVGGGSGKYYKSNFIRRNKDRIRLKLVQLNSEFKHWFNLEPL
jgi:hypothetical protein